MVASYLVHHSYCATAEAFAKSTDQAVHEELASIKNRQSESVGLNFYFIYMITCSRFLCTTLKLKLLFSIYNL